MHVSAFEAYPVDTLSVRVIRWSWVERQNFLQCLFLPGVEDSLRIGQKAYLKPGLRSLWGESAHSIGERISIAQVGFDVDNCGSVREVSARDSEHGSTGAVEIYLKKFHARKAETVRTEGRAGCEDPHPGVPPEPWRTHRQRTALRIEVESPYQPYARKALEPLYGVGVAVGGREVNLSPQ